MKEFGPTFNPERLTPLSFNPYANERSIMPEGTSSGPESHQSDTGTYVDPHEMREGHGETPVILDARGRPTKPTYQGETPQIVTDPRRPTETVRVSEPRSEELLDAWRAYTLHQHPEYIGQIPDDVEASLINMSRHGFPPPGFQEAPRARQRVESARGPRERIEDGEKLTPEQREFIQKQQDLAKELGVDSGPIKPSKEVIKREFDPYGGLKVNCAEFLAEEIMNYDPNPIFQEGGQYALLKEGEFQPDNFLRWVRHWMMYYHDDSPDEEHNFAQKIGLFRDFNTVHLGSMLDQAGRFFRSKDNVDEHGNYKVYHELVDQIKKEIWLFSTSRAFDIKYKQEMGSDEKLPSVISSMFYLNTFTKTVWNNRSSLYHIFSLPDEFIDSKVDPEKGESDHKLGKILNASYLAYYNLSDKAMLEEILGKDAPLLNADRIREAIKQQAKADGITSEEQLKSYIDPNMTKNLDKEDGLMTFINIFNNAGKPARLVRVVRGLLQESLKQKYNITGVDDSSVHYADTFAFSMMRWTGGAARNDTTAQGYDAWTRIQVTDEYRKKQVDPKRLGAFGNPYTIHLLKQLGTDFPTGTYVETMAPYGEGGKLTHKQLIDVMWEMQQASDPNNEKIKSKDEKEKERLFDEVASQLVFPDNTMRTYANDHLSRAFTIFQQVMGAEEIKLDKFTQFDNLRGITFDRKSFEEALKEKFFKPMRYGYSTFAQVNFSKQVRTPVIVGEKDGKAIQEYRTLRLGEAMFGREILNIPEFIKPDKKNIPIDSPHWEDKIDWDIVGSADGKEVLWRRIALTRIAAELYSHRDRHSTDPAYGAMYYESVIRALEAIPVDVSGNETTLKGSKGVGQGFTKEELKWLRKSASVEQWRLFRNLAAKDTFLGVTQGVWLSLQQMWKGMSK